MGIAKESAVTGGIYAPGNRVAMWSIGISFMLGAMSWRRSWRCGKGVSEGFWRILKGLGMAYLTVVLGCPVLLRGREGDC